MIEIFVSEGLEEECEFTDYFTVIGNRTTVETCNQGTLRLEKKTSIRNGKYIR